MPRRARILADGYPVHAQPEKPDPSRVLSPGFVSEADPRWITVPAGYRTDFASIPRLVWPLPPPVARSGKAADKF